MHNSDEIRVRISNSGSNKIIIDTNGADVRDGDWHHVAMTYDGSQSASGVNVYIDGVESPMKAAGSNNLSLTILNDEKLTIGNQREGVTDKFYKGEMDDARVYAFELTAGQVDTLYDSFVLSALANYQFEDNLLDSTGNGNTGSINIGGTETYVAGKIGQAFDFLGSTHIEISDAPFSFDRTDEFTLSAWIKTDITSVNDWLFGKMASDGKGGSVRKRV